MAPGSLSPVYLSDLSTCFAGETLLLSWDDLLDALLSHDIKRTEFAVELLSDDRPRQILSQTLPTFPSLSANSKTAFDTTIARINPSDSLYNIDDIKSDALWLSKQTNLDELEALRITYLEWQYRPEARLKEGLSEAETASLREALGSDYLDRQIQSQQGSYLRDDALFDTQNARRARLTSRYLQQQVNVFHIRRVLVETSHLPKEVPAFSTKLSAFATNLTHLGLSKTAKVEIESYTQAIQAQLEVLELGRNWEIEEPHLSQLKEISDTASLQTIAAVLDLFLLTTATSPTLSVTDDLLAWLRFVQSQGFFSTFTSEVEEQRLAIESIQLSVSLVTATIFSLASSISTLGLAASSGASLRPAESAEYFLDPSSAWEVHELVNFQAVAKNAQAGPAVLAWSLILQQIRALASEAKERRENHQIQRGVEGVATYDAATGRRGSSGSSASFQQSTFEEVWERIFNNHPTDSNEQTDPADQLLEAAISGCQVFEYIIYLSKQIPAPTTILSAYRLQTLQELVAVSLSFVGYTRETVSAQVSLMSGPPVKPCTPILFDPCLEMLQSSQLLQGFYDISIARFPYETLPLLRFSRALAKTNIFEHGTHYVEFRLKNLSTFAQAAGDGVDFSTVREDENANWVVLNSPTHMLNPLQIQTLLLESSSREPTEGEIIPARTLGQVISESSPLVIRWEHQYSGLGYMGKFVELYYLKLAFTYVSPKESPEEIVSEILSFVATLFSTILATGSPDSTDETQQHCTRILDELGSYLNQGADFTTYLFEVLEQELQSFRRRTVSSFDRRVLISCLDLIVVLTKVRSSQVWSNLNRTSLFGRHAADGLVLGVVSAVEIPARNFDFLEKCSELYYALFQLALILPPPETPTGRRQAARPESTISTIQRVQSPIILASTEVMFTVFQQIQEWDFDSRVQFARINTRIAKSFADILCSAFNFGNSMGSQLRTTVAFSKAANFLIAAFRPNNTEDNPARPIVQYLYAAGCGNERSTGIGYGNESHVKSILSLATLLVRYGMILNLPLSTTETSAFNTMPALARILQLYPSYRPTCLILMQSLILYIDRHRHQPSSLLGHFGSASCMDFIHLLKHVDQSSQTSRTRDEIWRLLSLLVKSTQQWVATVALTGSSPDGSRKLKTAEQTVKSLRGKTFLLTAIHELGDIATLSKVVAISMLEFVSQAQSDWSWVTDNLKSSHAFFTKIVRYVTSENEYGNDEVQLALHNYVAALVTDLSTTHLHHSKLTQDKTAITTYVPLVKWLSENAIKVASYKASLHANLRKNFAAKYNGLTVSDIRRTGLVERRYGINYFYDVDHAGRLFSHDPHWNVSPNRSLDQSFAAEFRRANTNLSLVDSELLLLFSLHHFCAEHCKLFTQSQETQLIMTQMVHNCLKANGDIYPSEKIFDTLFQTRADLSLAILPQLLASGAKSSSMSGLLGPAWALLAKRDESYDRAIVNNDLVYWRSMLSILAIVVRYHGTRKPKPLVIPGTDAALVLFEPTDTIFLEIATSIVAEGFKTAVNAIQDQKLNPSRPQADENRNVGLRDVTLLLTIFQAILRLPKLAQFSTELSERLSSSGMISSCLLLFSWSHILGSSESDSQAGYAELCLQFLVSLSSLPLVAEELAVEGVLNRILNSKTIEGLQRVPGGVSHADQRPNCSSLYRIWAGGVLPLCLNLLHAVGGAIAIEISNCLNQFPNQLIRATVSFQLTNQTRKDGTDVLTLHKASESSTLALISRILSSYREAGASAAVEPGAILPLLEYDEYRKGIMDDLGDNLALNPEARAGMTVPTNERELAWQKSVEGDLLDAKIMKELRLAMAALRRSEDDDEK